jgi:hypothetical protein
MLPTQLTNDEQAKVYGKIYGKLLRLPRDDLRRSFALDTLPVRIEKMLQQKRKGT